MVGGGWGAEGERKINYAAITSLQEKNEALKMHH